MSEIVSPKNTGKYRKVKRILWISLSLLLVLIAGVALWFTTLIGKMGFGPMSYLLDNAPPIVITEQKLDYEEVALRVMVDGKAVVGTIYRPRDARQPREVIIFSHGFAGTSAHMGVRAKSLAQAGVASVVFDFRGGSPKSKSDGAMQNTTLWTELADLNAVTDAVQALEWVDASRIYLSGESFGGMVSALTAAKRDDVHGLVLMYPALHTHDSAREQFATVEDIPEAQETFGITTGREFWAALWNLDLYGEIAKYSGEVIILHGSADPAVNLSYSIRANGVYENSPRSCSSSKGPGTASRAMISRACSRLSAPSSTRVVTHFRSRVTNINEERFAVLQERDQAVTARPPTPRPLHKVGFLV